MRSLDIGPNENDEKPLLMYSLLPMDFVYFQ